MKKILLSALAFVALAANAQESATVNTDVLGVSAEKTYTSANVPAGTVFASTASIEMAAAFAEPYQWIGVNGPKEGEENYNVFAFGATELSGYGVQGQNNPKDADGGAPATTLKAPVGGAAFQFTAKADGFLYVLHKASSNKSYTVFEEGTAIGYTFVMATDGSKGNLPKIVSFELKGEGEYNEVKNAIDWPEKIALGSAYEATADGKGYGLSGLSIIKFPVFDGCKYIVGATGSKMTALGYYYDTTGTADASIKLPSGDALQLLAGGTPVAAAINGVEADVVAAPAVKKYVENGQIVIEKAGKKFTAAGAQLK